MLATNKARSKQKEQESKRQRPHKLNQGKLNYSANRQFAKNVNYVRRKQANKKQESKHVRKQESIEGESIEARK